MTLKLARALPGVPGRNFVLPIDRMHYEAAPPYLVDMPALSRRMEMDLAKRVVLYIVTICLVVCRPRNLLNTQKICCVMCSGS